MEDLNDEYRREKAIIQCEKIEELNNYNNEYEDSINRKPAKIIVLTPVKNEVQDISLTF
jgi:Skp family chaperone for outer membrane proteins